MSAGAKTATRLTAKSSKLAKQGSKLSAAEAKQLKAALDSATTYRGFRDFKGGQSWLKYMKSDATLSSKISAGVPRLWGNPATRALMRKTKWYLGLLDFLGVANFVGPDELENKIEDLDSKMAEYNNTPEAQQNWNEDIQTTEQPSPEYSQEVSAPEPPKETNNKSGDDIFGFLFT